jgi:hypothetical protein
VARLRDYSFGRIVVDGEEQTFDLIVLPWARARTVACSLLAP